MAYDTDRFRADYRAAIHPAYRAWVHAGFVFLFAIGAFGYFVSRIESLEPIHLLAIPLTLVFFNWGEFTVHRSFGHRKHPLGKLFYRRHTGDHHSFFVSARMPYEEARDFRVVLFPAWLIVLYTGLLAFPAYCVVGLVDRSLGALVAATLLFGYLTYEFFHTTQHLPDSNPLTRLPGVRQMRRLHQIHHRRSVMQSKNFNLTFPLMDVLHGTLQWEPEGEELATTAEPSGVLDAER